MLFRSTAVEYFVSWIMEKMFHARWWDYSHYKFNINGRICLLNSVLFGFLGLGVIHFVYPQMLRFLEWIGDLTITISTDVIGLALAADMIVTVRKLVDFSSTIAKIKTFGESLRDYYGSEAWFHGESFEAMLESVKKYSEANKDKINRNILEKIEKFQTARNKAAESFMAHFPTMKSIQYKEEFEHLRKHLTEKLKKLRK